MPLVGVDWSQTGVAHLFSAIKVCCIPSYAFEVLWFLRFLFHPFSLQFRKKKRTLLMWQNFGLPTLAYFLSQKYSLLPQVI